MMDFSSINLFHALLKASRSKAIIIFSGKEFQISCTLGKEIYLLAVLALLPLIMSGHPLVLLLCERENTSMHQMHLNILPMLAINDESNFCQL